jgi:hypothetical protein
VATEDKDIRRIIDTLAGLIAQNPPDGKHALLTDVAQNYAQVWKVGGLYIFPAVSKSTTDGISFAYYDGVFKDLTANGNIYAGDGIIHTGDTDTALIFNTDVVSLRAGNVDFLVIDKTGASAIGKLAGDTAINKTPDGGAQFEIQSSEGTITKSAIKISHSDVDVPITAITDIFNVEIQSPVYGGIKITSATGEGGCGPAPLAFGLYHGVTGPNNPAMVLDVGKLDFAGTGIDPLTYEDTAVKITNDGSDFIDVMGDAEIYTHRGALRGLVNRTLWIKTSDTTVANTVTETSIGGTIVTFPANFLKEFKAFRLRLAGFFSTKSTGAGNLTVKVKLGSTVIAQSEAFSLDANIVNGFWELGECCFAIRTEGATGTIMGQCGFKHSFADVAQDELHIATMANTIPVTINTTIAQALTVTVQFSVNNVANTITCTCGHVDEVY